MLRSTRSSKHTQHISGLFAAFAFLVICFSTIPTNVVQTDIIGPAGSGRFGTNVTALPNGNIVVTDPNYSIPAANVGAVYLYNGSRAH